LRNASDPGQDTDVRRPAGRGSPPSPPATAATVSVSRPLRTAAFSARRECAGTGGRGPGVLIRRCGGRDGGSGNGGPGALQGLDDPPVVVEAAGRCFSDGTPPSGGA
jgi:hypothetical protein